MDTCHLQKCRYQIATIHVLPFVSCHCQLSVPGQVWRITSPSNTYLAYLMDPEADSGTTPSLPPGKVKALVQKCFSAANERLTEFRAQKIRLNINTARRQANNQLPNDKNLCFNGESEAAVARRDGSVSNAIFSIPNHPKEKSILKSVSQCPGGLSWVRVRTNMRAADQGKDSFFVPYIGESEKHLNFSNKLAADTFEVDERIADDISEDEGAEDEDESHGAVCDEERSEQSKKTNQSVQNAKSAGSTSPLSTEGKRKLSERVWARAAKRVGLKLVFEKLDCSSLKSIASDVCDVFGFESTAQAARCLRNVTYRQKKYEETDQEEKTKSCYRTEMIEILNGSVKSKPAEILKGDSIPFFVCRQCYTYNCFLHGNYTAKPSDTIPDKTRKDSTIRQISKEIELNCEHRTKKKCWHVDECLQECKSWWKNIERDVGKAEDIRAVVLELYGIFGADPCRIASSCKFLLASFHRGLELTCCRVGYLFDKVEGIRPAEPKQKNRRRFRKSPYSVESCKSKRRTMRMEDENGLKGGLRRDFEPCHHSGLCTAKSCPCVMNGVNCEKYCSCNHTRSHQDRADRRLTCANAFKGCSCKSSVACVSNACICYSWKRECDPDICRACHECKPGRGEKSCGNSGLLTGKRKRIVVGHSDTHGWGAFAAAPISKNEIIGEYVGEIVDQEHADRRGRLYDEVQYSFLFNITDDFALDSTRVGNKLRFCNHAFAPNCEARLMRVAGDIRVGFYAKRDIAKHEELFFDYKYKFGPDWAVPAKDKKLTPTFKDKPNTAPIAKKRASSNQGEQRIAKSVANGKRPNDDDSPFHTKIKRVKTMYKSTRSQTKSQKTETPQLPPSPATSKKMNTPQSRSADEQQSKSSPADKLPVKRPLSVWRGVLRRVVPRATEPDNADFCRPPQRSIPSAPTNSPELPSVEEVQEPVERGPKEILPPMPNKTKPRGPRSRYSEGSTNGIITQPGKDYQNGKPGRTLKTRSLSSSPIIARKSPRSSPVLKTREASRKVGPSSSPKIESFVSPTTKQVAVSPSPYSQRLIMRRRLKEIFGSDDESDENDNEVDMEQTKVRPLSIERENASPPLIARSRKRNLLSSQHVDDIVPLKRPRSSPSRRGENVSLGKSPRTSNETGDMKNLSLSVTENRNVHNRKDATLESVQVSKVPEKVTNRANRRGWSKQQSSAQPMDDLSQNSPYTLPSKQNGNPANLSEYRSRRSLHHDRGRTGSPLQRSKRTENDRSSSTAYLAYSHRLRREHEQKDADANIQSPQAPELHIPMVNLVSDEESESRSGSFDPKFF
eukprot:TRINITY_DN3044_c0_g1_i1.p1 TRINITY_DN3044_c0_g1~~TRINITY_DN3044_c0_g1_i1.p1  ORF type:complete len:1297 (+),score=145.40 TRINITY_DN3044_c0_g1_i1:11387-15277(+)